MYLIIRSNNYDLSDLEVINQNKIDLSGFDLFKTYLVFNLNFGIFDAIKVTPVYCEVPTLFNKIIFKYDSLNEIEKNKLKNACYDLNIDFQKW